MIVVFCIIAMICYSNPFNFHAFANELAVYAVLLFSQIERRHFVNPVESCGLNFKLLFFSI